MAKRYQYIACVAFFLLGVALFGCTLDRYPAFCIDEPFFNVSAVRHIDGKSFAYEVHSDAPHSGKLWAYHGPLFFRMQVFTHKLIGPSHFAARFPSYFAGNAAVLLMALMLIRRGLWPAAICLQVLWLGDRSLLENMGGRQEGVSHLCVVAAAMLLIPASGRRGTPIYAGIGFLIGIAAGLNPAGIYYALAVALFLSLTQPWRRTVARLGLCVVGGLLASLLVMWCWLPDIRASFSQFLWHYGFNARLPSEGMIHRALVSWQGLRWSLPWNLAMLASCLGAIGYVCTLTLRRIRRGPFAEDEALVMALAACFASASAIMYLYSSLFTTYLVYLTLWAALFARLFAHRLWHAKHRVLASALTVCVMTTWLPSATWNTLRCREAISTYAQLDEAPLVKQLASRLPGNVAVYADPHLYIAAHKARRNFTPLHWYITDTPQDIPADAWIVISERYTDVFARKPEYLAARYEVGKAVFAEKSTYHRRDYAIWAPKQ